MHGVNDLLFHNQPVLMSADHNRNIKFAWDLDPGALFRDLYVLMPNKDLER